VQIEINDLFASTLLDWARDETGDVDWDTLAFRLSREAAPTPKEPKA
jgi:hypothetical protein